MAVEQDLYRYTFTFDGALAADDLMQRYFMLKLAIAEWAKQLGIRVPMLNFAYRDKPANVATLSLIPDAHRTSFEESVLGDSKFGGWFEVTTTRCVPRTQDRRGVFGMYPSGSPLAV